MAFVVQWTPIGPEMSVSLNSSEDVRDLMNELNAPGRALNVRVVEDGQIVSLGELSSQSTD